MKKIKSNETKWTTQEINFAVRSVLNDRSKYLMRSI